ncbi:ABC transporter permease [Falsibacillus pallidus]|uniref:Transport permease protein n=1 Tax=Falsibacillus pallidus TaxID=493781 RepID=A0A370GCV8_9BACI|nr:ABC transporter permease [Falsibacillus pallidus]RDI41016.1 ABC-2 type transport system permease protein [Falsibacillus pallidus]
MKELLWLIRHTLKVTFNTRRSFIIYFGMPLIGILIAFAAYGGSNVQTIHIGIASQDRGEASSGTISFLKNIDHVKVTEIKDSAIADQISSGKLDVVIKIDEGFTQSLMDGNPSGIQMVSIKGAQVTSFIKAYLYQYLDNVAAIGKTAHGDQKAFHEMYANYQKENFSMKTVSLKDLSKNRDMTSQTIGFLLMFLLMSAGNLSEIILKEKENRTYFRLLSTPISARKYVLSNILVNMIIMAVQISFTIYMMNNVFHIETNMAFGEMLFILLVFALVAVGLGLIIVAFTSSTASFGALQNFLVIPTCMLSGCFWPVAIMPDAAQKIAEFLPQHWALSAIDKLQKGISIGSIYLNILILLAFAAAFFLVAIYRFGRNNNARNFI